MIGRRWVLALAAVLSLVGCGAGDGGTASAEPYRPPSLPEQREHARDALARYDAAVGNVSGPRRFVPVGELTGAVGGLESDDGDLKQAVAAGRLVPGAVLPGAPSRPQQIVWADGVSRSVAVISAEEALVAHRRQGAEGCDGCVPVTVIGARPASMRIATSAGEATVPAWEYTLGETTLKVTYAAVGSSDTVTVTPPPWDPDDPPDGEGIDAATTTRNGREVTVSFTGAVGSADRSCGADYPRPCLSCDPSPGGPCWRGRRVDPSA